MSFIQQLLKRVLRLLAGYSARQVNKRTPSFSRTSAGAHRFLFFGELVTWAHADQETHLVDSQFVDCCGGEIELSPEPAPQFSSFKYAYHSFQTENSVVKALRSPP